MLLTHPPNLEHQYSSSAQRLTVGGKKNSVLRKQLEKKKNIKI
jgi:hypothetical protein